VVAYGRPVRRDSVQVTRAVRTGPSRTVTTLDRRLVAARQFVITLSSPIGLDVQCCAVLLALSAIMLLPGVLNLPMELWDESRNAVNAMEMVKYGNWMVSTFDHAPDHWNTKPPLLIWIIASLLRSGLDPMLAVRLPSVAAIMTCVLLVYFICRWTIQDRAAGVLSGLLLICSVLVMGDHVGRTGDYDALLTLLSLGFVVCAGRYVDDEASGRGRWIAAGSVLLFLAIMTKGVAAATTLPGLVGYAIVRRRFLTLLRDWRVWLSAIAVIAGVAVWLVLREGVDPGYFAAMWNNDVSGRLLTAEDQHTGSSLFYLKTLSRSFEPAFALIPMLLFVIRSHDRGRDRLCLLMMLTACSCLIVVTSASTKLYWYAAPALPLLAVSVSVATVAFVRHQSWKWAAAIVISPVAIAGMLTFWYLNVRISDVTNLHAAGPNAADQVWYGPFLEELRRDTRLYDVVIVDHGLYGGSESKHGNPVALFFAEDAGRRGEHIQIVAPDMPIAGEATIVSCDSRVRDWLKAQAFFTVIRANARCIMGRAGMGLGNLVVPIR
jgi:4-amino-4-deoxy-L-arabinose transferase-like glycosyltransferase